MRPKLPREAGWPRPTLPPPYTRSMPRSTSCCPSCTAAAWYAAFLPALLPQNTQTRLNRDGSFLSLAGAVFGITSAAVVDVGASMGSLSIDRLDFAGSCAHVLAMQVESRWAEGKGSKG